MKKLLALLLLSPLAFAEFKLSDDIVLFGIKGSDVTPGIFDCKDRVNCIYFEGQIEEGDFLKFEEVLLTKIKNYYLESYNQNSKNLQYLLNNQSTYDLNQYEKIQPFRIFINSKGGNVNEALKMAGLIRNLELMVNVPMDSECFSACFYLYSAGVLRFSNSKSVGIHSPSFDKKFFSQLSQNEAKLIYKGMEAEAYDLLREFNIPERLISKMKSVSSQDLYYLSDTDLIDIVIDRIYKERLISYDVNLNLRDESRNFVDTNELVSTTQELVFKNLSNMFPDLIENDSLSNIIFTTDLWQMMNFQHTSRMNIGFGNKMSYEEVLKQYVKDYPKEAENYYQMIAGAKQTKWYEAMRSFDEVFGLMSNSAIEDIYKKGNLVPYAKSLEDVRIAILTLALMQSYLPPESFSE